MARAGHRVVLVDADLRRPRLHELFGLGGRVGLSSLIIGEAPIVEALQPVRGLSSLSVIPAGPKPPNPSELLSSSRFTEVMSALRDSGFTVVVDCPPMLEASDGVVVAASASAVILVTSARTGSRRRIRRAVSLLVRANAP